MFAYAAQAQPASPAQGGSAFILLELSKYFILLIHAARKGALRRGRKGYQPYPTFVFSCQPHPAPASRFLFRTLLTQNLVVRGIDAVFVEIIERFCCEL